MLNVLEFFSIWVFSNQNCKLLKGLRLSWILLLNNKPKKLQRHITRMNKPLQDGSYKQNKNIFVPRPVIGCISEAKDSNEIRKSRTGSSAEGESI